MIKLKSGVSISGIQPEMVLALCIIERILLTYSVETVVTSAVDSKHGRGSLHFVGFAIDLRTRDMKPEKLAPVTLELQEALGDEFDVVLESNHFHIEYQPKTGVNL